MNAPKRLPPSTSVRRASGVRPIHVGEPSSRPELERAPEMAPAPAFESKVADELGRLGCLCAELAAALARLVAEQERLRAEAPAPARCA